MPRNTNSIRQQAFTLIELLVVISIIGLLSSVVLASLTTARAKARDAQRYSNLTQIRNALNLYASDHNGAFPTSFGSSMDVGGDWSGAFKTDLAPYLPNIPKDPRNGIVDHVGAGQNIYAYHMVTPGWTSWPAACHNHIILYAYPAETNAPRHNECGAGAAPYSFIIQ